jgi:hypothetical protein
MTTAAVPFTSDVEAIPRLLGARMRIDDVGALPAGTVLAWSPHSSPTPVELVGVEGVDRRTHRAGRAGTKTVRMVRVRRLSGPQAGETERIEAKELRGLWETFMDACRAEHAARQPLLDACAALEAAAVAAEFTGQVLQRMYANHAEDKVSLELPPADAQRLAALLQLTAPAHTCELDEETGRHYQSDGFPCPHDG